MEILLLAIVDNDIEQIKFSLSRKNFDINSRLINKRSRLSGFSPLILAIENNRHDIINMLISEGADVNIGCNSYEKSALHYAISKQSIITTAILLGQTGIDIEIANIDSQTALHYAAKYSLPKVINLLLIKGADATKKDANGKTVLDLAIATGCKKSILMLTGFGIKD